MELDEQAVAEIVADKVARALLGDPKFTERIENRLVERAGKAYTDEVDRIVKVKADAIVSACVTERLGPTLTRIDRAIEGIVVEAVGKAKKHAADLDATIAAQVREAKLDHDKVTTAFRKAIRDEVHRSLGTSIDRFSAKWAKATLDEVKP